jgi:hypothetical protein
MNFKIVKYGMVVLTGREKADMANADVFVDWMLCWRAGGREGERKLMWRGQK